MFPPALIGALFVKKLTSYAMYQAASNYGWPRVYKRVLELNRIHTPLQHQETVRFAVRGAIESPLKIYNVITDSKVVDFAKNVAQSNEIINDEKFKTSAQPPSFLMGLASIVAKSNTPMKFLSALEEEAKKKRG